MTSKGSKMVVWGFLAVWALFMIVFTFYDLNLSQAVYNAESKFGHFFEVYGEHPALIILFAAGSILFNTAKYRQGMSNLFIRLVGGLFILLGGFAGVLFVFVRGFDRSDGTAMLISLAVTAAIAVIVQLLLNRIPEDTLKMYNKAAWAGIAIIFAEMLVVNVVKIFWGRLRFREMGDDFSQFSRWFLPNGIQENGVTGEAYKSFPSGHSANGWAIWAGLLFMPLKNKWRSAMLVIAIVWGLCTSYSRIIMGAHFATDVLVGAFITIACMLIICKWFKIELYPPVGTELQAR